MDRAAAFVRSRSPEWQRFEQLSAEYARAGGVPPARAVEFARLYRGVAADLSAARSMGCGRETERRLNAAVSLGHGVVYRTRAGAPRVGGGVLRALLVGFPAAFRRHPRLSILAVSLFLVPALAAYLYVAEDPGRVHEVFPGLESVIQPRSPGEKPHLNVLPASLSSFYVVNNTMVAIKTLAMGMLLGAGTVWILALNGTLLGALAAHFGHRGDLAGFWPQVMPHGVTELLSVVAAGLAGLLFAKAIWRPGDLSRLDALVEVSREIGILALGCFVLMLWSGLVESYLTRSTDDDALRNGFAGVMALAVAAWFLAAFRVDAAAEAREAGRVTAPVRPSASGTGSPRRA